MNMIKKNWSDISTVAISLEAIRALHVPVENFKTYLSTHEAGTIFPTKAGHAFTLYVLAGSCKTTVAGSDVTLSASEFITLDQGAYTFEVVSDDAVKLVKVFSLS